MDVKCTPPGRPRGVGRHRIGGQAVGVADVGAVAVAGGIRVVGVFMPGGGVDGYLPPDPDVFAVQHPRTAGQRDGRVPCPYRREGAGIEQRLREVRRRVLSVDAQAQGSRAQRADAHTRSGNRACLAGLDTDPAGVRGRECTGLAGVVCQRAYFVPGHRLPRRHFH